MAIRDRVRRALRKSEASDSSSQADTNALATTTTSNTSQSSNNTLEKTTTRLARVLTFGNSSNSDKETDAIKEKKKREKREKKSRNNGRAHPRDKPLTAQNLRHQELLNQFSMTFGASDPNQIETQSFMGVSPCCTRPSSRRPSISLDMTGSTTSFSTAAATDSTRE
jgi:hypothetical protein